MCVFNLKEFRGAQGVQVADEYSLRGRERIFRQSERSNSWRIECRNGGGICEVVILIAISDLEAQYMKDQNMYMVKLYGVEARDDEFRE